MVLFIYIFCSGALIVQLNIFQVPFLCIHGADDQIALPTSSDYIFEHAGTPAAHRQKHIIANAKHEPFHEIESIRTAAIAFVVQYFETQYLNKDLVVEDSSLVVTEAGEGESSVGAAVSSSVGASGGAVVSSSSTAAATREPETVPEPEAVDVGDINVGVELTSQ